MAHVVVKEAEEQLDQSHAVLDKGFVRLVDYLGGDSRVVQAARVSYGAGTKSVREDRKLIHYLLKNKHTSPFEQVVLTFHLKMPIFVARQWVRHRTARLNEVSARYSELRDEFYVPRLEDLRAQSDTNKQSRSSQSIDKEVGSKILEEWKRSAADSHGRYVRNLSAGLAREVARVDLPVSVYTEMYWQIDLHNLLHFLLLRLSAHAQLEIREYARVIAFLTKCVAPETYAAFQEFELESVTLSNRERQILAAHLSGAKVLSSEELSAVLLKLRDF